MIVKFIGAAFAAISIVTLMVSCAAPTPKMQELEPNSYMVTVRAEKNADGKKIARQIAMAEAEKLCTAQGKYVRTSHLLAGVSEQLLGGDVEMNFRCVDQPSPDS
ncbi:MAG: hypothetical protein ACT4PZ_02435 [Panacagrimonas sp.]